MNAPKETIEPTPLSAGQREGLETIDDPRERAMVEFYIQYVAGRTAMDADVQEIVEFNKRINQLALPLGFTLDQVTVAAQKNINVISGTTSISPPPITEADRTAILKGIEDDRDRMITAFFLAHLQEINAEPDIRQTIAQLTPKTRGLGFTVLEMLKIGGKYLDAYRASPLPSPAISSITDSTSSESIDESLQAAAFKSLIKEIHEHLNISDPTTDPDSMSTTEAVRATLSLLLETVQTRPLNGPTIALLKEAIQKNLTIESKKLLLAELSAGYWYENQQMLFMTLFVDQDFNAATIRDAVMDNDAKTWPKYLINHFRLRNNPLEVYMRELAVINSDGEATLRGIERRHPTFIARPYEAVAIVDDLATLYEAKGLGTKEKHLLAAGVDGTSKDRKEKDPYGLIKTLAPDGVIDEAIAAQYASADTKGAEIIVTGKFPGIESGKEDDASLLAFWEQYREDHKDVDPSLLFGVLSQVITLLSTEDAKSTMARGLVKDFLEKTDTGAGLTNFNHDDYFDWQITDLINENPAYFDKMAHILVHGSGIDAAVAARHLAAAIDTRDDLPKGSRFRQVIEKFTQEHDLTESDHLADRIFIFIYQFEKDHQQLAVVAISQIYSTHIDVLIKEKVATVGDKRGRALVDDVFKRLHKNHALLARFAPEFLEGCIKNHITTLSITTDLKESEARLLLESTLTSAPFSLHTISLAHNLATRISPKNGRLLLRVFAEHEWLPAAHAMFITRFLTESLIADLDAELMTKLDQDPSTWPPELVALRDLRYNPFTVYAREIRDVPEVISATLDEETFDREYAPIARYYPGQKAAMINDINDARRILAGTYTEPDAADLTERNPFGFIPELIADLKTSKLLGRSPKKLLEKLVTHRKNSDIAPRTHARITLVETTHSTDKTRKATELNNLWLSYFGETRGLPSSLRYDTQKLIASRVDPEEATIAKILRNSAMDDILKDLHPSGVGLISCYQDSTDEEVIATRLSEDEALCDTMVAILFEGTIINAAAAGRFLARSNSTKTATYDPSIDIKVMRAFLDHDDYLESGDLAHRLFAFVYFAHQTHPGILRGILAQALCHQKVRATIPSNFDITDDDANTELATQLKETFPLIGRFPHEEVKKMLIVAKAADERKVLKPDDKLRGILAAIPVPDDFDTEPFLEFLSQVKKTWAPHEAVAVPMAILPKGMQVFIQGTQGVYNSQAWTIQIHHQPDSGVNHVYEANLSIENGKIKKHNFTKLKSGNQKRAIAKLCTYAAHQHVESTRCPELFECVELPGDFDAGATLAALRANKDLAPPEEVEFTGISRNHGAKIFIAPHRSSRDIASWNLRININDRDFNLEFTNGRLISINSIVTDEEKAQLQNMGIYIAHTFFVRQEDTRPSPQAPQEPPPTPPAPDETEDNDTSEGADLGGSPPPPSAPTIPSPAPRRVPLRRTGPLQVDVRPREQKQISTAKKALNKLKAAGNEGLVKLANGKELTEDEIDALLVFKVVKLEHTNKPGYQRVTGDDLRLAIANNELFDHDFFVLKRVPCMQATSFTPLYDERPPEHEDYTGVMSIKNKAASDAAFEKRALYDQAELPPLSNMLGTFSTTLRIVADAHEDPESLAIARRIVGRKELPFLRGLAYHREYHKPNSSFLGGGDQWLEEYITINRAAVLGNPDDENAQGENQELDLKIAQLEALNIEDKLAELRQTFDGLEAEIEAWKELKTEMIEARTAELEAARNELTMDELFEWLKLDMPGVAEFEKSRKPLSTDQLVEFAELQLITDLRSKTRVRVAELKRSSDRWALNIPMEIAILEEELKGLDEEVEKQLASRRVALRKRIEFYEDMLEHGKDRELTKLREEKEKKVAEFEDLCHLFEKIRAQSSIAAEDPNAGLRPSKTEDLSDISDPESDLQKRLTQVDTLLIYHDQLARLEGLPEDKRPENFADLQKNLHELIGDTDREKLEKTKDSLNRKIQSFVLKAIGIPELDAAQERLRNLKQNLKELEKKEDQPSEEADEKGPSKEDIERAIKMEQRQINELYAPDDAIYREGGDVTGPVKVVLNRPVQSRRTFSMGVYEPLRRADYLSAA